MIFIATLTHELKLALTFSLIFLMRNKLQQFISWKIKKKSVPKKLKCKIFPITSMEIAFFSKKLFLDMLMHLGLLSIFSIFSRIFVFTSIFFSWFNLPKHCILNAIQISIKKKPSEDLVKCSLIHFEIIESLGSPKI